MRFFVFGIIRIMCSELNYALRAELCNFASAHNSGSPVKFDGIDVCMITEGKKLVLLTEMFEFVC